MKLHSGYIYEYFCYFFTDGIKSPRVWIRKINGKYYLCGGIYLLKKYAKKESKIGFKNIHNAISCMKEIHKIYTSMDKKELIQLCLVQSNGKPYLDENLIEKNKISKLIQKNKPKAKQ